MEREAPKVVRKAFGSHPDGGELELFELSTGGPVRVEVTNAGGSLVAIYAPDRAGSIANVLLRYNDGADYGPNPYHLGCIVGRCAGRIAGGRAEIGGTRHSLLLNDGANHLHGGPRGFHTRLWEARPFATSDAAHLALTLRSRSGDQGYPGDLFVQAVYSLYSDGRLSLDFRADSDAPTIVNLANHAYFNLEAEGAIEGHRLFIAADHYLPTDPQTVPTGKIAALEGTPFDFRAERAIGERIEDRHPELVAADGYDQTFVLRKGIDRRLPAARLYAPKSGRAMELFTSAPALVFYSGNKLARPRSDGRVSFARRAGLCLEAQAFPDAPNHSGFPGIEIGAGAPYRSRTSYRFGSA